MRDSFCGLLSAHTARGLFFHIGWIFAGGCDEAEHSADFHFLTFGNGDVSEHAGFIGFHRHRRLIRLHVGQFLAGPHLVAFFLMPFYDRSLGHGIAQLRHRDLYGHSVSVSLLGLRSKGPADSRSLPVRGKPLASAPLVH